VLGVKKIVPYRLENLALCFLLDVALDRLDLSVLVKFDLVYFLAELGKLLEQGLLSNVCEISGRHTSRGSSKRPHLVGDIAQSSGTLRMEVWDQAIAVDFPSDPNCMSSGVLTCLSAWLQYLPWGHLPPGKQVLWRKLG
jgi:hypothetical protein